MTSERVHQVPSFLDDAIAGWAERAPDLAAVHWQDQVFSYAELERDVSRLVQTLTAQGVGRGQRVGVAMAKSYDAIVAVFAILRAGAAYVPLDPAAPIARSLTIVQDCGITCILVDKARLRLWADLPIATLYDMTRSIWVRHEAVTPSPPQPRLADDLAYILYTSGSTGTPKGIAHTHRSGLAYATMAADLCGLTAEDRVSHHTPMHFDMSIFDVFSTTSAGASIVVISEMHAKMPASLSALVEQTKITVWYSVPHALIQMNARGALEARDLSALRVVMFAGEKMPIRQLQSIARRVPEAIFINAYGPTETNACTSFSVAASAVSGLETLPIGTAEPGIDVLVEDGALCVAGDQVMLGYWDDLVAGRESLTRQTGKDGVERAYYRTGDMIRIEGDDMILVGREDRQVKLRGFRVELDEVEAVIARLDGVIEAAVVLDDAGTGLRAFVGLAPNTSLTTEAIDAHCAEYLPAYSVPHQIRILADLTRTSTGKINRKAMAKMAYDEH